MVLQRLRRVLCIDWALLKLVHLFEEISLTHAFVYEYVRFLVQRLISRVFRRGAIKFYTITKTDTEE